MRRRRLPSDWKRIREVFLRRRASYDLTEVPALLGIPRAAVHAAIDQGTITRLSSRASSEGPGRAGRQAHSTSPTRPGPSLDARDDRGDDFRIDWEDVVTLGLEHRWTYRMLTAALRGLDAAALPVLVRVITRPVLLPRYQWQVLRLLAARQSQRERREITVSDLIEDAVSTAVLMRIDDWEALEAELPGVRAAAEWPQED